MLFKILSDLLQPNCRLHAPAPRHCKNLRGISLEFLFLSFINQICCNTSIRRDILMKIGAETNVVTAIYKIIFDLPVFNGLQLVQEFTKNEVFR